jgi:hypothetical protein
MFTTSSTLIDKLETTCDACPRDAVTTLSLEAGDLKLCQHHTDLYEAKMAVAA